MITIKKYYEEAHILNFRFYNKTDKRPSSYKCSLHIPCEICDDVWVDDDYYRIIKALKKAGLLDKDYLLICCDCYRNKIRGK